MTVAGSSPAQAAPDFQTLTATSADAFIDTVGVNTHTNYTDTIYGDQDRTLRLLKELGIRHVRDGLKADNKPMHAALRRLRDNGIRSTLISEPSGRYGSGSLAAQIAALKDPNKLAGVAVALEGPNELDCKSTWLDTTRAQQAQLTNALAGESALRGLPLLGPSWCRGVRSVKAYGNDGAASDAWNLHPYPGGYMPESEVGGQLGPEAGISGQISVANGIERQDIYATETGYHNAINGDGNGHNPTSERASGPYAARLALEYARLGVKRTFFYELQDERSESSLTEREQAFGLVRHDGTPKPSFTHLQALLATLKDPGATVGSRSVKVGFGNAPSDLRRMAFARRDGSVDLVLWRAASLWDVGAKKDLSVPSVDLNVVAEKSTNASVVKISNGSGRTSLGKGSSFSVAIGGSPVIVRFAYMATGTTPTDPTPAGSTIRVDVGSARPVTSGGTSWVADTGFTGGTAGTARTAVPGTTSPEVYRNYRWGMKTYALPIANGTYTVRLLMAEDTWRTAGKRVFSVTAEGVPALSNVDIFSAVGKDKALIRTFRAKVTDGRLDLGFSASVDNAIISGIEIQASS